MKRIGILTYHRSFNYGAFLQAYSLSTRLQQDFQDCRVEIIDYTSDYASRSYRGKKIDYIVMFLKAQGMRKKLSIVKLFCKSIFSKHESESKMRKDLFYEAVETLSLSKKSITTDNIHKFFNEIKGEYDAIIVGSDAVWNWQMRLFPTPFFLEGNIGAVKMSYAASSYAQDYNKASIRQRRYVAKALSGFSYLGVRDEATEKVIKMLLPDVTPYHNCDPTVFLDMQKLPVSAKSVYEKIISYGVDLEKPVICLMGADWLGKVLRDTVGNQYQIVSVFVKNNYSDVHINDLNPFEWAIAFSFFALTVTHYFHGNLLSLKNGVPTLVIEKRNDYNRKYNSKIRDFMKRVNLYSNCYFYEEYNSEEIYHRINELINNSSSFSESIKRELLKEKTYYDDFKKSLSTILYGEDD